MSYPFVAIPTQAKIKSLAVLPALGILLASYSPALAADVAPDTTAAPAAWMDTIKFSGHLDGGISFNPADKTGSENFGDLTNDKTNQVMLNQFMATVERPIDSKATGYDFGFRLQGMFGADSRYTHGFNELNHLIDDRNQLDVVEASVSAHLPVWTEGGVDLKVGQFPTPMGAEVIDATGNYLYSHSYIYNFGIPLKQTGALATLHVNSLLDLYAGVDTGVNAFIGNGGWNNDALKEQFGFGLNMLDGNLTVLGFTHIGAENPASAGFSRYALRYLNDITTTWKVNDNLTLINDANYISDEGLGAIGYGMAQYAVYALNDKLSLVGRAEIWRDNSGAFVSAVPGNFDYVNAEEGLPATVITAPRTTYGELTVGLNYKPEVPKAIEGFVIRPELRVDHSLNGTHPFDIGSAGTGKDGTSFTPAVDVVIPF